MKAIHIVMVVCGALAASLPGLAAGLPASSSPFVMAAAQVCALVATVLGAVSGKAGEPGAPSVTNVISPAPVVP